MIKLSATTITLLKAEYPYLSAEDAWQASKCERSLFEFVKQAWPHAEKDELVEGKHIEMLCRHLQAITEGKISNFIANQPPRTTKSSIVNVLWPAWEWGPAGKPEMTYVCIAHAKELVVRDSEKCHMFLNSEWYQRRWGHKWAFSKTQNAKSYYKNDKGGYRKACVISSATGWGGDRMIFDDLVDANSGVTPVELEKVIGFWKKSISPRLNDPGKTARIIIMQRVHENDISGYLLENDKHNNWVHLNMPAEFEEKNKCVTPFGEDWRTVEGEILWPEGWGRAPGGAKKFLEGQQTSMGLYLYSCQFQQNPTPSKGGIFLNDWWQTYTSLPNLLQIWFTSWDLAIKDKTTSDWSVGVVFCYLPDLKRYYVVDVYRQRVEYVDQKKLMQMVSYKYPHCVAHVIEDKGNGSALIQELNSDAQLIRGSVLPFDPKGTKKEARFRLVSPTVEGKRVFLPGIASWKDKFLHELGRVPMSTYDDQADAFTQGILWNEMRGQLPGTELIQIGRPGQHVIGEKFSKESLFNSGSKMPRFY